MCRAIVGNVPGRGGGWLGDCGLGGVERVMCSIDGQISFMGTAPWNQGHMAAHPVNLEFNADENVICISHICKDLN